MQPEDIFQVLLLLHVTRAL